MLVPSTSVGTAIDRASASLTPGPSPAMADSSDGQGLPVLDSQKFSHRVKIVRRLARQPVGRVRCLEIGAAPGARRDCAGALQPPHRAACWRAPRAIAMPGARAPGAMTRSGWRTAILSAIAAPIEMPPTTNRSTPRRVGEGQHVVGEGGDRIARRDRRPTIGPGRGIPASAGETRRRRERLRRPAPRRRRARAGRRPAGRRLRSRPRKRDAATLEREPAHAAVSSATTRRRNAATAGASASLSPWVTSGPSKSGSAQAAHEMPEVDDPCAGRGKAAVGAPVLGMRHDDAVGKQVDRLRDDRAGLGRGCRLEQIGGIEHDLDARRAKAVDQLPRQLGRRHDVGQLRLDAEVDAALLGERRRPWPSPPAGRARPRCLHCPDDAPTGRSGGACRCTA